MCRAIWSTAAAACIAAASTAHADDVTMNLGWETPLDSSYGDFASKFKELTEEYSDSTVTVRLRCCGQIASEDNAFKALQLGTVDGYFISNSNISPHWSNMDVFTLPYIFQNPQQMIKVADGPIGQSIKDDLLEATGVHLLTFGGPSYRDFFNSVRPIETIEDLDGLKIRVPQNEVMLATLEAFGAEPVPLAWSETPTALQTGTIDGGDNGTSVIQEMKFYEFAEYLTILNHFSGFTPLFASERFMSQLDESQLEAVRRAAKEAGEYDTEQQLKATEEVRAWLVGEGGMTATEPDLEPFVAAAQKVQEDFAAERDESFNALLEQLRAVPVE